MVYRTLFYLILLVSSVSVCAQVNPLYFGGTAGIYFSNLNNELLRGDSDFKIGAAPSLLVEKHLNPKLSLSIGISYQNKGDNVGVVLTDENGNPIVDVEFRSHFHYLILPIETRYYFGEVFRPFVSLGLYGGYLLTAFSTLHEDIVDAGKIDNYNAIPNWDAGFSAGGGLSLSIKEVDKIEVALQGNIGLYDIGPPSSVRTTLRSYMMSIGYKKRI